MQRKPKRRELLFDFIMSGLLVLFWSGFLLYQIKRITDTPIPSAQLVSHLGLSITVFLVLTLSLGISLYKKSMSYIQWYKEILDTIPMWVIVTDKDARWRYINKTALKSMTLNQEFQVENLNSKHLIDEENGAISRVWIYRGAEYRISGSRLHFEGDDAGYMFLYYNNSELFESSKAQAQDGLVHEVNRLLGCLTAATEQFNDCSNSFTQCAVRQEEIISELAEVIAGIYSGTLDNPDILDKKIRDATADVQRHVESYRDYIETIRKTVEELNVTRDSISSVLHNINSEQ